MGSTLTNTQPKDTYKSLLKTSDSTELSATAKYVSDGNGNDSPLALSTSEVGIGTTSPTAKLDVAGGITLAASNALNWGARGGIAQDGSYNFSWSTNGVANAFNITSATGNVGIGTASPQQVLDTKNMVIGGAVIAANYRPNSLLIDNNGGTSRFYSLSGGLGTTGAYAFNAANSNVTVNSEIVRIDADGLKFNGDTAAANALDDYEEGTFTPTFTGVTYSGATSNLGRYTKIGRLVHFDIFIYDAAFSSSSGPARIGGLPFTANVQVYGQGLITYNTAIDGNTNGGYVDAGSTNFYPVDENSTAVASFINGTVSLMVSGTYTV